jgi:formamidopyrimidine-DNA glycosylase
MGADVLRLDPDKAPGKHQVKLTLLEGGGYTVRFWWFGKYLLVTDEGLQSEPSTRDIAIDPFDSRFTLEYFAELVRGRRTRVKAFLLDQRSVSGIGNMYMHDILFLARVHPQLRLSDMTDADISALYRAISAVLTRARARGFYSYEVDFYGERGALGMDDFLIGYRERKPCPECGTAIELIKTGSTTSYICINCQKL